MALAAAVDRTGEKCPSASALLWLAAFDTKLVVAGGNGELARLEGVAIHRNTHGAAGFTPLGASVAKDAVEPFGFGVVFDLSGSWDDKHTDTRSDGAATDDVRGLAQVA